MYENLIKSDSAVFEKTYFIFGMNDLNFELDFLSKILFKIKNSKRLISVYFQSTEKIFFCKMLTKPPSILSNHQLEIEFSYLSTFSLITSHFFKIVYYVILNSIRKI